MTFRPIYLNHSKPKPKAVNAKSTKTPTTSPLSQYSYVQKQKRRHVRPSQRWVIYWVPIPVSTTFHKISKKITYSFFLGLIRHTQLL